MRSSLCVDHDRAYVYRGITIYSALVYAFLSISAVVEGAYPRVFALHVTIESLCSPHALQMIFASSFAASPLPDLAIISRALVSTIYGQKQRSDLTNPSRCSSARDLWISKPFIIRRIWSAFLIFLDS